MRNSVCSSDFSFGAILLSFGVSLAAFAVFLIIDNLFLNFHYQSISGLYIYLAFVTYSFLSIRLGSFLTLTNEKIEWRIMLLFPFAMWGKREFRELVAVFKLNSPRSNFPDLYVLKSINGKEIYFFDIFKIDDLEERLRDSVMAHTVQRGLSEQNISKHSK